MRSGARRGMLLIMDGRATLVDCPAFLGRPANGWELSRTGPHHEQ
jgi:hypothetical protein